MLLCRQPVSPKDFAKLLAKALARAESDLPPDFDPLPEDMRDEHAFVPWLQVHPRRLHNQPCNCHNTFPLSH